MEQTSGSANQIRIVPSVPRASRRRTETQEVAPKVQEPKSDRFKIIPLKPKSLLKNTKRNQEVIEKPPKAQESEPEIVEMQEVKEPEMDTDAEETEVTIEVTLDSVEEAEEEETATRAGDSSKVVSCFTL